MVSTSIVIDLGPWKRYIEFQLLQANYLAIHHSFSLWRWCNPCNLATGMSRTFNPYQAFRTVDGSEIRLTSWGNGSLSHYLHGYMVLAPIPRWLGRGFQASIPVAESPLNLLEGLRGEHAKSKSSFHSSTGQWKIHPFVARQPTCDSQMSIFGFHVMKGFLSLKFQDFLPGTDLPSFGGWCSTGGWTRPFSALKGRFGTRFSGGQTWSNCGR